MNYEIEKLDVNHLEDYVRLDALTWNQSYKGIVDDNYLELLNTETKILESISRLKEGLNDGSKRFLLKYNNEYVGFLRVRKTKYDKYKECGELGALYLINNAKNKGFGKIMFNKAKEELKNMGYNKMILGCLSENPSNNFYKHMGCEFVGTNPLTIPSGQELIENLYIYNL